MKTLEIKTNVQVFQLEELPEQLQQLVETAKQQCAKSYSPYSQFRVGAAALMENGEVFAGSNQENAAYPSGLCAERTTLFYAQAQRPDVPVRAIAIAAFHKGAFTAVPTPPCGACRQVMVETELRGQKPLQILLYGTEGIYSLQSAQDLLPLVFDGDQLIAE